MKIERPICPQGVGGGGPRMASEGAGGGVILDFKKMIKKNIRDE